MSDRPASTPNAQFDVQGVTAAMRRSHAQPRPLKWGDLSRRSPLAGKALTGAEAYANYGKDSSAPFRASAAVSLLERHDGGDGIGTAQRIGTRCSSPAIEQQGLRRGRVRSSSGGCPPSGAGRNLPSVCCATVVWSETVFGLTKSYQLTLFAHICQPSGKSG